MSRKFRPMLSALEGRDVPASLSFTLPDGTVGTGTFLIPSSVDPSEAGQTLVTSFQMTLGGWLGATQPDALALFSYGEFEGLIVAVSGIQTVQIDGGTATGDDGLSAPVTYDVSDVQLQFLFSGDTPGTVSYEVPWGQVDPTQASQSVTPTGFKLNISGQTFAPGSASFTTAPALNFEYGDLKGVTFAVDTSAAATATGFAFTAVSMSGGLGVTATQAWNGQPLFTNAAAPVAYLAVDFKTITTGKDYVLTVSLEYSDGTKVELPIDVGKAATATQIRDLVYQGLDDRGVTVVSTGETTLTMKNKKFANLKSVDIIARTVDSFTPPAFVGKLGSIDYNKK